MSDASAGTKLGRWAEWLPVGLVLAGVLLLHAAAVRRPFFADDYLFLEQVRGKTIVEALTTPDPLGNFFRPVGRAGYFWVISRLAGESPAIFHSVNLGLFLAALLALYATARRLAGRGTALTAMAFVGLHYSADVPLRWASGAQDLLAILFATLAIYLHSKGRRALAVACLLVGLLSKEVVAGAALIAIVIAWDSRGRGFVRSHGALLVAVICWGMVLVAALGRRVGGATGLAVEFSDLPAAYAHLVQVILGAELRLGGEPFGHWGAVALAPAILAGLACWLGYRAEPAGPSPDSEPDRSRWHAIRVGVAWSLLGAAPIVAVASIWSAYFYLWSLFGVGLLLGGLSSNLRPSWRAALIAALVLLSSNARRLDEFAPVKGAWTWQSHVNRHYVDRALATIDKYLGELRKARPTLPPRSTVYFANVPVASGWQTANGPLIRWAFGDSTLRSYFLGQFEPGAASRGNVYFFAVEDGALKDKTEDPDVLLSLAYSLLLAERPRAAIDALELAERRWPSRSETRYWRAWAHWQLGDSTAASQLLETCGYQRSATLPPGTEAAFSTTAGDSSARLALLHGLRDRACLSAWVHARLAAALLASGPSPEGTIEAFAYRVLAPEQPDAWRKWASAQIAEGQYEPALASLNRYFALAGTSAKNDPEAEKAAATLKRLLSGDAAHKALR